VKDSTIKKKMDIVNKKKFPEVKIEEVNSGQSGITELESAIPVFIGYTMMATENSGQDLFLKPKKIATMADFEKFFGKAFVNRISIKVTRNSTGKYDIESISGNTPLFLLYHTIRHYFDNGGGACYIISSGIFTENSTLSLYGDVRAKIGKVSGLLPALKQAGQLDEATLLVIPEAVHLAQNDYQILVGEMLNLCKSKMNCFSIFDFYPGNLGPDKFNLQTFRLLYGTQNLRFGATYYPFVKTNYPLPLDKEESNVVVTFQGIEQQLDEIKNSDENLYQFVSAQLNKNFLVLPASGAIAGLICKNDHDKGVWKAPANIAFTNVTGPLFKLNSSQQEQFHIDTRNGISVNTIAEFSGKGTLVWGARTLAGNDNEWKYIQVQRFISLMEESISKSTEWVVFEPNDASTWVKVKSIISNYLTQKWRQGALSGSKPEHAFYVKCGLGETMTSQDIHNGNLIIEMGLAMVRPAEFIIIRINHKTK
jgi:hypothetical protein